MLAKDKLNTTQILISKDLIESNVSHDVCVSVNVLIWYEMTWYERNNKSLKTLNLSSYIELTWHIQTY